MGKHQVKIYVQDFILQLIKEKWFFIPVQSVSVFSDQNKYVGLIHTQTPNKFEFHIQTLYLVSKVSPLHHTNMDRGGHFQNRSQCCADRDHGDTLLLDRDNCPNPDSEGSQKS